MYSIIWFISQVLGGNFLEGGESSLSFWGKAQSISQIVDSTFQLYILVTEDEMGGMKWLDQKKNSGTIDTYMDTNEHSINVQSL